MAMVLKNVDVNNLSRLSSLQVDQVTCMNCCKYYVVPTTATCGHSLCHSCWRVRRTCPICGVQVEKKNLKLNLPLQSLKDHVQLLVDAFEDLFNVKLNEFTFDITTDKEIKDSNKHVKEWLASSQNHFSAPLTESQQSVPEQTNSIEQVTSNVQIHSEKKRSPKSIKVVHVPPLQIDWDKIDEIPDIESDSKKEQNAIGPMDIEPFDCVDDKDYSTEKPRRSSRNKENKNNNLNKVFAELSSVKNSENDLTVDSINKPHKLDKNWNNVKRMKKEFSKLNKKNRNKLNVSIEMCKKTKYIANKAVEPTSQNKLYDIDDNTPEASASIEVRETSNCNNPVEEITKIVNVDVNQQKSEDVAENNYTISKDSFQTQNVNIKGKHSKIEQQITKETCTDNVRTQKICFFKKSALNKEDTLQGNRKMKDIGSNVNSNANCIVNADDIEITIKIGRTLTNICIKKKENDVQLKINSDCEVQTNFEDINEYSKQTTTCSPITKSNLQNTNIIENTKKDKLNIGVSKPVTTPRIQILERSSPVKKSTASADTVTGNFEITESVERELSNIIDNAQLINEQNKPISTNKSGSNSKCQTKSHQSASKTLKDIPEDMDYLNALDIFDSESIKEGNVQLLKTSKNTSSAILMPSIKSNKSLKDKRDREAMDSDELPINKKIKLTDNITNDDRIMNNLNETKNVEQDSENMNYDAIMSQVFANIDADIGNTRKTIEPIKVTHNLNCNNSISRPTDVLCVTQRSDGNNDDNKQYANQKYSENIFSMVEKDSEILEMSKSKTATQIQNEREDTMLSVKPTNMDVDTKKIEPCSETNDIEIVEFSTPLHDDDSDKSIVEETPQKSTSFSKNINKNELTIVRNTQGLLSKNTKKPFKQIQEAQKNLDIDIDDPINILSLSDTLGESTKTSRNLTVVETVKHKTTSETPLTITKFVDQIKHKSTPMARKSLNFYNQNEDDPEQTLCPSSFVAAKTTQEKEFMHKAFDQSQTSIQNSYTSKNHLRGVKFCVGGSCLSSSEQANLKLLCLQRNWTYVDKYTKELTHLVVGVDEENKSQRSVKYMCTLAASKWIVSYKWVEKCLQTTDIVDEEPFEAFDATGEPGPRRSRIAKQKLFQGITFYCMPPFSVLDADTLKGMVQAAGGRVCAAADGARAATAPALLLAEPERTQDDKFMYIAMELSIVPVNYEWVLNCLGSYTLGSIYELLLCPASLLPPITSQWPPELISRDYE